MIDNSFNSVEQVCAILAREPGNDKPNCNFFVHLLYNKRTESLSMDADVKYKIIRENGL